MHAGFIMRPIKRCAAFRAGTWRLIISASRRLCAYSGIIKGGVSRSFFVRARLSAIMASMGRHQHSATSDALHPLCKAVYGTCL